jgi:hypothetical protein
MNHRHSISGGILSNGYAVVWETRPVPWIDGISRPAIATLAPFTPLPSTAFSPEDLLLKIINIAF